MSVQTFVIFPGLAEHEHARTGSAFEKVIGLVAFVKTGFGDKFVGEFLHLGGGDSVLELKKHVESNHNMKLLIYKYFYSFFNGRTLP